MEQDNEWYQKRSSFVPEEFAETLSLTVEESDGISRQIEEWWDTNLNEASQKTILFLESNIAKFTSASGSILTSLQSVDQNYEMNADGSVPVYVVGSFFNWFCFLNLLVNDLLLIWFQVIF